MVTPPRPLNRPPIASPAPSGPIQQQPISYQPVYNFGANNWFTRQRAQTLMQAWADLRMIPNVNVPYIDANGNVMAARESGTTFKNTAENNILIGDNAGDSISSGTDHICIGKSAGASLTDGSGDIFIGGLAGQLATIGGGTSQYRTVVGDQAAKLMTTAHGIVAIGRAAGRGFTTDIRSVAIGHAAQFYGGGTTQCIAIGDAAGGSPVDGTSTVHWGLLNDTEVYLIGTETGKASSVARTNAWAMGYRAKVPAKDNVMALGSSAMTDLITTAHLWHGYSRSVCSASSTAATFTTTNIVSGYCQRTSATSSGSDSFPSAADIIAAGPGGGCAVPTSMRWRLLNTSTVSRDLSTGVGVVISGDRTVLASQGTEWLIEITNSNTSSASAAITVYRMSS